MFQLIRNIWENYYFKIDSRGKTTRWEIFHRDQHFELKTLK